MWLHLTYLVFGCKIFLILFYSPDITPPTPTTPEGRTGAHRRSKSGPRKHSPDRTERQAFKNGTRRREEAPPSALRARSSPPWPPTLPTALALSVEDLYGRKDLLRTQDCFLFNYSLNQR